MITKFYITFIHSLMVLTLAARCSWRLMRGWDHSELIQNNFK